MTSLKVDKETYLDNDGWELPPLGPPRLPAGAASEVAGDHFMPSLSSPGTGERGTSPRCRYLLGLLLVHYIRGLFPSERRVRNEVRTAYPNRANIFSVLY